MSILALIENLITEHGSPVVIKERLGFLGDQISALEKKNGTLKSDNASLKSKKDTIESQLNKAKKKIERMNQLIQKIEKDDAKTRLDAATERVLKMFFYRRRELSVDEVAATFFNDVRTAWYHLSLLLENNLIEQTRAGFISVQARGSSPLFGLTPFGREYVLGNIRR